VDVVSSDDTADGPAGGLAAGARLLWEQPAAPRRGPRPALTLDKIARAGVGIADRDGLAAVTMQRVADGLGVTKMALYRYVPGKAELVALMTDLAIGGAPARDAAGGWRASLDDWARQMFSRFGRHPWTLETTVGPRIIGPNETSWMERAVAILAGTGLHGGEMLDVAATLAGHVRAIAQQRSAQADGSTERSMAAAIEALLAGREERFPALTAALRSAARQGSQDQALEFGIGRILDGVGLLIDRRAQATSPP
jgi:AcrR family transcriptional regulator